MDPALAHGAVPVAFEDGLGRRHHMVDAANEPLEVLALHGELTAVASFDFALRERVSRLANFKHACYGHVRGVSRLDQGSSKLALVSDRVLGDRLSDILSTAERELLPLDIGAGLCLIRQLVDAVAILHQTVRDACHGAIAPERIIITPDARLVVVEHVLGAALAGLSFSRERYWKELRIALPQGPTAFDRRADVTQVGVIALALIMGRPLRDEEFPERINEIAARVGAVSSTGGFEPLPEALGQWLSRVLQLDPQSSFASAVEARDDLDHVLAAMQYKGGPAALKSFLAQYRTCAAATPPRAPAVAPAVPVAAPPASVATVPPAQTQRPSAVRSTPAQRPSGVRPAPKKAGQGYEPMRGTPQRAQADIAKGRSSWRTRRIAVAVLLVAVASGATLAARRYLTPPAVGPAMGMLAINTNPAGVPVIVDGKPRGLTPINARLAAGNHTFELVTDGERRVVPVTITAGGQVSQFIELPKTAAGVGELQIRTEPAGARVTVDGHFFGTSPLTVNTLTPGVHLVLLENELGSIDEEVTIEAGVTATLVVPLSGAQGSPASGWISVNSPIDVQLYENHQLLGSSKSDRIMVAAGRHEFEIVSDAIGYRLTRTVTVAAGQVTPIKVDLPKGSIAINASPWAEVWIDGERIGETPIGNMSVAIGSHDVVFRHPELGEQRQRVTVTLDTPARLSVDLRKP